MYYYKSIDETGLYASSSPITTNEIVEITKSEYEELTEDYNQQNVPALVGSPGKDGAQNDGTNG